MDMSHTPTTVINPTTMDRKHLPLAKKIMITNQQLRRNYTNKKEIRRGLQVLTDRPWTKLKACTPTITLLAVYSCKETYLCPNVYPNVAKTLSLTDWNKVLNMIANANDSKTNQLDLDLLKPMKLVYDIHRPDIICLEYILHVPMQNFLTEDSCHNSEE